MSYRSLDELEIYRTAERVADRCYDLVKAWNAFDRETTGAQLVRAADSIGANIAEGYGRYHYGDRLQFMYYARGSAYETKYWMRRATRRGLLATEVGPRAEEVFTALIMRLNAFIRDLRTQRQQSSSAKSVGEMPAGYETEFDMPINYVESDDPNPIF